MAIATAELIYARIFEPTAHSLCRCMLEMPLTQAPG